MTCFNMIAETTENTVLAEYEPAERKSENYQSEAELEREFIKMLCEQGYSYLEIHSEPELIANLRSQIERLNSYKFSDSDWGKFLQGFIAAKNKGVAAKTFTIQREPRKDWKLEDGTTKNITLFDKENVHNNCLQVIHQYEVGKDSGAKHANRYDVTILVNGLPLVHVELKRRGVRLREAYDQIQRYKRESVSAGQKLFQYVQIFVVSNGTETKYYSNTTEGFEKTIYWADARNKSISDLVDFTRTFFAKSTILNILAKYCVFTTEKKLMIMRPYQITATERILNRIKFAENYKKYGTRDAGGYIWHTTGSGKTLTSFKTAQLATSLPYIDKVLFVVDRKDLDYQTMCEYDSFQKGAANSSSSTAVLERHLRNPQSRIIITTIQKLSKFVKRSRFHEVYDKKVVLIFDECHRSQFGEMHRSIAKSFKKYCIFGFTGTPIFPENAKLPNLAPIYRDKVTNRSALGLPDDPQFITTEALFGERLHSYTIIDAINDKAVLPFRVDYIKTMRPKPDIVDAQVWDINREEVLLAPERISKITEYVLAHYDQKTNQHRFNALFGVSSIKAAQKYYDEFKKQIAENPGRKLKVATIFSYAPNESEEENSESTEKLSKTAKEFLDRAIAEYNAENETEFSTDGESFQNYYKDVSQRMKEKKLDLLIVVNMFLTGFDAKTLNTLFVDKNLRMHGLIQAFSRTNRILDSVKTFGNIVCFRDLQQEVDEAIALFADEKSGGVVLLRKFEDYYFGYDEDGKHHQGYVEMVDELKERFSLPLSLRELKKRGKLEVKGFIMLFGAILRMKNLLAAFDEFEGKDLLSDRDWQDYKSLYLDIHDEPHPAPDTPEPIVDDVEFEIELIRQIEINIDYILMQIAKYHEGKCMEEEIVVSVLKAVDASMELRSKKALIEAFIANINGVYDVVEDWQKFTASERDKDLEKIIASENLDPEKTRKFMENCFYLGEVRTTGPDVDGLLPDISRRGGARGKAKARVIEKLQSFYEKFSGIGGEFKADAPRVEFNFGTAPAGAILAPDFDSNFRAAEKNRE